MTSQPHNYRRDIQILERMATRAETGETASAISRDFGFPPKSRAVYNITYRYRHLLPTIKVKGHFTYKRSSVFRNRPSVDK